MDRITKELFELRDEDYQKFHAKLIPEVDSERVIGVRTPVLRAYAKRIAGEPYAREFLQELPHKYYEENNLHSELLCLIYKDIEELLEKLEIFLPYMDNWATCDLTSPKIFKKNLPLVYGHVQKWIHSEETFTIRFGVVTLLGYFMDDAFLPEHLELVEGISSKEYYVRMAVAWYFSIALVKHYEETLPHILEHRLDTWTHNKAIQKATESLRIDKETKAYLRSLKIK